MDKGLEQTFFQRQHTNVQEVHEKKRKEKMLRITNHREMQIKTTKHYFTPIRLAIIKTNQHKKQKTGNNKCW